MGNRGRGGDTAKPSLRVSKGAGAKRRRRKAPAGLASDNRKTRTKPRAPSACAYLAALLAAEIGPPTLEYRFHPVRRWRFDIAYPEHKTACEIHGSVFHGGRHTSGIGFTNDREKMNEAQLLGWIVLEYPTSVVRKEPGRIVDEVRRAMARG